VNPRYKFSIYILNRLEGENLLNKNSSDMHVTLQTKET